jgi:hypothetical protein
MRPLDREDVGVELGRPVVAGLGDGGGDDRGEKEEAEEE